MTSKIKKNIYKYVKGKVLKLFILTLENSLHPPSFFETDHFIDKSTIKMPSHLSVYKKEPPICHLYSVGYKLAEGDSHQDRSTRIFFFSQSQKLHSQVIVHYVLN
jgi:hypothetical protein